MYFTCSSEILAFNMAFEITFDMTINILDMSGKLVNFDISMVLDISDISDVSNILDIFNMRSYAQILCLFNYRRRK